MKERLMTRVVPLLLVAVLVVAGVVASQPGKSQAAGTTYTVVVQAGSPLVSMNSVAGSAPVTQASSNEGVTFKMVVDAKAKTEKLKTGPASYYPVTILVKTYKSPEGHFMAPGAGAVTRASFMKKDAKGKLYISGGDVDVASVLGKKLVSKIGDGTVDPAGSMIIPAFNITSVITLESTVKVFMTTPVLQTFTTGQSSLVVSGSKTRLEGKKLPADDYRYQYLKAVLGQPSCKL